jgi:uncharacterized protein (TIGR02452 family)
MNAPTAMRIAEQTLAAFELGYYIPPSGARAELDAPLGVLLAATRAYDPGELAQLRETTLPHARFTEDGAITLSKETSLSGAARLLASGACQRVGVLNFASARKPGGGFLNGARAQEESLARSSALSLSLNCCPEFYAFHRAQQTALYSDRMIYSPQCPVIRDDHGGWLDAPILIDFITSPAPNAGAVMRNEPENRARITPTLTERAAKILALAASQDCDALVLGAWGCGVFQNDPAAVARIFAEQLTPGAPFARHFRHVLFAVYDTSHDQSVYGAFARRFAAG